MDIQTVVKRQLEHCWLSSYCIIIFSAVGKHWFEVLPGCEEDNKAMEACSKVQM